MECGRILSYLLSLCSVRQVATLRHGHIARRFAPAFRALGVCEHIWLLYNNFDPNCFDPIQKFGMSTWGLTLIFDLVPSTYFRPPVTVVDALAPNRLNQGSLCNPETNATEVEARRIEKYRELIDNGYIFQPVALEIQGSSDESSEIFITGLCKMLCRSHDDQRVGSFSITDFNGSSNLQCGLCSRNCEQQRCVRKNLLHRTFFKPLYHRIE